MGSVGVLSIGGCWGGAPVESVAPRPAARELARAQEVPPRVRVSEEKAGAHGRREASRRVVGIALLCRTAREELTTPRSRESHRGAALVAQLRPRVRERGLELRLGGARRLEARLTLTRRLPRGDELLLHPPKLCFGCRFGEGAKIGARVMGKSIMRKS